MKPELPQVLSGSIARESWPNDSMAEMGPTDKRVVGKLHLPPLL